MRRLSIGASLVVIAGLAVSARAQPPVRDAAALAPFVGLWTAEDRDLAVTLWLSLALDGEELAGDWSAYGEDGGPAVYATLVRGRRLEVATEDDGYGVGRLVLELAADGRTMRVVEGRGSGRRIAPVTLVRRDQLWRAMRTELRDLAHDADGDAHSLRELRFYAARLDAARQGIEDAGAAALLASPTEAQCVLDFVGGRFGAPTPPQGCRPERPSTCAAALAEVRAFAAALARARGSGPICSVDPSAIRVEATAAAPAADACARVVVQDADGTTTVRTQPSSRSAAAGTLPSGASAQVAERRGRWIRIGGAVAGWVFADNVRCDPR